MSKLTDGIFCGGITFVLASTYSGFRRSKPNHLPVNKCIGLVGFLSRRHFLRAKGNILEGGLGPQGVILHLKSLRLHQRMH